MSELLVRSLLVSKELYDDELARSSVMRTLRRLAERAADAAGYELEDGLATWQAAFAEQSMGDDGALVLSALTPLQVERATAVHLTLILRVVRR